MKTSSGVHWKSPAEGHLLKLLECDWRVTHFKSQPVTVFYTLDGIQTQRHIPDALALGGPYPVLFEVKSLSVNYVCARRHFAERDDCRSEMV